MKEIEKRIRVLEEYKNRNITAREHLAEKLSKVDFLGFIPYWRGDEFGFYDLPENCAGIIYNKLVLLEEPKTPRFHQKAPVDNSNTSQE